MKNIFLILLVVLFAACGGSKNITIDKLSYEKTDKDFSYKIEVPQINGTNNKKVEEINMGMVAETQEVIDSIANNDDDAPAEYLKSYEEFKNDFGITSIIVSTYAIAKGDVHGYEISESINVKNSDGSLVDFNSFFKKGAEEYLNKQIVEMAKEGSGKKVLNSLGKEVAFFEDPEVNVKNSAMFFEGNDVCFKFDAYELAPYSEGQPIIRFPKAEIKEYMK